MPDWYFELAQGDWSLHVLNAEHGDVGYLNEVMAVYRVHNRGYWSGRDYLLCLEEEIRSYETVNKHLNYKYQSTVRSVISNHSYELAKGYEGAGDLGKARVYALRCFTGRLLDRRVPDKGLPGMLLRLYAPWLYKPLRGSKNFLRRVWAGFMS